MANNLLAGSWPWPSLVSNLKTQVNLEGNIRTCRENRPTQFLLIISIKFPWNFDMVWCKLKFVEFSSTDEVFGKICNFIMLFGPKVSISTWNSCGKSILITRQAKNWTCAPRLAHHCSIYWTTNNNSIQKNTWISKTSFIL